MKKTKTNKCKCCNSALNDVESHLIFDENGKRLNIAFLLFDYIGKTVDESDGQQQAVCDGCLNQLIHCYEFKQKCVEAIENDSDDEEAVEEESDCNYLVTIITDDVNDDHDFESDAAAFDKYDEIIEEYADEIVDNCESVVAVATDPTQLENETEFLNNLYEFDLIIANDEEQFRTDDTIEFLEVAADDEPDDAFGETEESAGCGSEVISLNEYALDRTSKTVKKIGNFNFNFVRFFFFNFSISCFTKFIPIQSPSKICVD